MEQSKIDYKTTDIGLIPKDWSVVQLGDLANVVGGGTPSTLNNKYWNGDINWFTPTEIGLHKYSYQSERKLTNKGLSSCSARLLPRGTILLTTRAGIGDASILMNEASTNQGFQSLISNQRVNNEYLYYMVLTLKNVFLQFASGSTFLELSPKKLKSIRIPLPPTLSEQTAIASALSDADSYINSIEKLIAKKRLIKQGAMQELLRPKEGWKEFTLNESASLKARIGWQGLNISEYQTSGDYYLITGTEFQNGNIAWEKCFYVHEKRYNQDKNIQVKVNDVLVTKDGTIGKIAQIKSLPKPATLNSGVFVIRPINHSFYSDFFYYILLSEVFRKFLSQLSAGSTINHLYQKDFVTFQFFAPQALDEQNRIANILSDMDNEIQALEKQLEKPGTSNKV